MANSFSSRTGRVALSGVLAAGSLVLLWLACMTPSGRMGITAVAGLFPMTCVLAAGRTAGYLCWAASGILGLVILPDKGVCLMYLAFLGLYPVVKSRIEALRRQGLEWALKLVFFNLALSVFWFVFQNIFLPNPPEWLAGSILALYGVGNVAFIVYDYGLSKLIAMLQARLRFDRRR